MSKEVGQQRHWTHPSARAIAGDSADPLAAIVERSQALTFEAFESGWSGPPYDPVALADLLQIPLVPREDIPDARTMPDGAGGYRIEFNPNRPRGRLRYSVAHELAHTLFPDCGERVRNRESAEHRRREDWQLELLCNVGAAEILMPIGSFAALKGESMAIEHLMDLRKQFDVSAEALLLRASRVSGGDGAVFCASRTSDAADAPYRLDYLVPARTGFQGHRPGAPIPRESIVANCVAIGFTAKGDEHWSPGIGAVHVECVGIPPYPGHRYPRVVGILQPRDAEDRRAPEVTYVRGDATRPSGKGRHIVAHVVNNRTPNWGAGFARVVRKQWPAVQDDFREWVEGDVERLNLGAFHTSPVDSRITVAHMVCQEGYGPSIRPRVRYAAMRTCLSKLASFALLQKAAVHLPRIGCGQAGGSWEVVEELIEDVLVRKGVRVTVYDLPDSPFPKAAQRSLNFRGGSRSTT